MCWVWVCKINIQNNNNKYLKVLFSYFLSILIIWREQVQNIGNSIFGQDSCNYDIIAGHQLLAVMDYIEDNISLDTC